MGRRLRRRSAPTLARVALVALAACALSGCARLPSIVVLWSDRAELAAYVETFNASDAPVKVELIHVEEPARELLRGTALPEFEAPDLVLGSWLASPELTGLLAPLDELLRDRLEATAFYPELLAQGMAGQRQTSLPFAFNLPVIVFARDAVPADLNQFVISVEELRALGREYVAGPPARPTRIGFSPLWNMELVYYLAAARGGGFASTGGGQVVIDESAVQAALAVAHDWINLSHGGIAPDDQFQSTYFHQPFYALVLEGRIRMYLSDVVSFHLIPERKRAQLDFRWLAVDGRVPVIDSYRSFAIPAAASNPAGARRFLSWIFQPQVQARLLATATLKRLRVFGLAGGFPALRGVSELTLPRYQEFLIGRLPDAELLRVPASTPPGWNQAKQQVVWPWMRAAVAAGGIPPSTAPGLTAAVRAWREDALRLTVQSGFR